MTIEPMNWNEVEDDTDMVVWNRLTSNMWLDTTIAYSNDLQSWRHMTPEEQELVVRTLAGLTMLDTLQGTVGAVSMIPDAQTHIEEAVLCYIAWNECVHQKTYSSSLATLISRKEIREGFEWAHSNQWMKQKVDTIHRYYRGDDPVKKKIASVALESMLFYSSFYCPLYNTSRGNLTNMGDAIKLILKDEAVHGYYLGYKVQRHLEAADEEYRNEIKEWTYNLFLDLYHAEVEYTKDLYDGLGRTEDVCAFVRYNANKALMNIGYDPLFPEDICIFDPGVMTSLSPNADENTDFFSGKPAYVIGTHEETTDADWNF